ncbi:MAG: TatD DNase family protein, partial [Abditibacteriota bacterium]|nr:TatD DNase family protein [Abditibacteriota bacterium]
MFFDSHCHLAAENLASQLHAVLQRAHAAGVTQILSIGDDIDASRFAIEQAESSIEGVSIWSTAGLHPQKALEWDEDTTDKLRELWLQPTVMAVGEIGLDFFYDDAHPEYPGATRERQEHVLREQLQSAIELDLPVVLHNRDADERLLSILGEFPKLRGVVHCFGSAQEVADRLLEKGFYLGFTGLVTFKNAQSVRDVAARCPLDCLLIETDAPFLAPVPHRGKTNEPSFVPLVAQTIARL